MALPTIQTSEGEMKILIAEYNGYYTPSSWNSEIIKNISGVSSLPVPRCLKSPEKQALLIEIIVMELCKLGDANKWRLIKAISSSDEENSILWDNYNSSEFVNLGAQAYNCTSLTFALVLSRLLELKPEFCFNTFPAECAYREAP